MSTSQELMIRKRRRALVCELRMRELYVRTHTSSGVWRRSDLIGEEPPAKSRLLSAKSLANLTKGRKA